MLYPYTVAPSRRKAARLLHVAYDNQSSQGVVPALPLSLLSGKPSCDYLASLTVCFTAGVKPFTDLERAAAVNVGLRLGADQHEFALTSPQSPEAGQQVGTRN